MSAEASNRSPLDVLVVGGGQAGLAMGRELSERRLRFDIVDAGTEIGHVWQSRWESLRMFTSGRYDNLPGLPFPADADAYPGKDDVVAYLQAYAAEFEMPVRLNSTVTSLTRTDGAYIAHTAPGVIEPRQVVIATGPFQTPFTPPISAQLDGDVAQLHSAEYRKPEGLPPGRVLVVGGSNSGCQIALELSKTHTVDLSVGKRLPTIPQRPLGRDVWSWATALRLDRVTASSRIGRRLSTRDQIIGVGPRRLSRRHGVRLRPRATAGAGRSVSFANGITAEYDVVIWATGYTSDNSWINIPGVTDNAGRLRQSRGVTPSPGLYTLGQAWQHTRGSALLGWVGDDASYLAQRIVEFTP
ncbi:flavin-containing monooxygenase [Glaciibacter sp. 2TAF33]|uniref:flavin-containing monooxygenase n=1 Tax=Glaciibacter sp. 2TAF33 TaxID=3233015 RepID=UPI003F930B65